MGSRNENLAFSALLFHLTKFDENVYIMIVFDEKFNGDTPIVIRVTGIATLGLETKGKTSSFKAFLIGKIL